MRILFVDDLKDARELFRIAFTLYGHCVRLASNGLEAVDLVKSGESFDAIVMDVEMPEMNGWDAVRAIRELPSGQDLPIVMFTAYGDSVSLKLAEEAGADDVLYKPLPPQELLNRISQLAN